MVSRIKDEIKNKAACQTGFEKNAGTGCCFCLNEEDTGVHAIFTCPWTDVYWDNGGFKDMLLAAPKTSCAELYHWMLEKLNDESRMRFLALSWSIWTCINMRLFDDEDPNPELVIVGFQKMVLDYREYMEVVEVRAEQDGLVGGSSWSPPLSGVVKINTNAAVFNSGEIGLGVVGRDVDGSVVVVGAKHIKAVWDTEMAEAQAVVFGMEVAHQVGVEKIAVESDSLTMINAI
ncbi:uncharacterized protein LOC141649070 [Silene latifolia]|uniref:uncharacterized protein LOC141649070 n=1 Tax=Silene latifolia TaxID=37657 RepID=UPI003D773D33